MTERVAMVVFGLTAGCGPLVDWSGEAVLIEASSDCMTSLETGTVVARDVHFVYEDCVDHKPVEARLSATIEDPSSERQTLEVDVALTDGECDQNYADHPEDCPVANAFDFRGSKGRHQISGIVEDSAGAMLSGDHMSFVWAEWKFQRAGEPGCSWTLLLGERPTVDDECSW